MTVFLTEDNLDPIIFSGILLQDTPHVWLCRGVVGNAEFPDAIELAADAVQARAQPSFGRVVDR